MPGPGIDSKPGYYLTVVTVVCGIYVGPNWHLGSAQHSVEFTYTGVELAAEFPHIDIFF